MHPADILYIEAEGRYCNIHTKENSFSIQLSFADLLKQLPKFFLRIHRNYIINTNKIKEVHPKDNLIVLKNDKTITLGRSYKVAFFEPYDVLI